MNYELLNTLFDAMIWIPISIMAIAYLVAVGIAVSNRIKGENK